LHPSCLPGRFGIGQLGREAWRFVDFLEEAHQRIWQVLPLGPTGYGDSPYQCFSAFAGNPLLISLDRLVEDGLLRAGDLEDPSFPDEAVDFGRVIPYAKEMLSRAYRRFQSEASSAGRSAFEDFCKRHEAWLEDYALFSVMKQAHDGLPWTQWEEALAERRPEALQSWAERHREPMKGIKFSQFLFFKQWAALREHCRAQGVSILGDLPLFVAHDSADVWAHREFFHLGSDGKPTVLSGVPPDYFSATGQLWGSPLYRWDVLARTGFDWWLRRVKATLALVDAVRLDHFRGFEACWEVPASETTAINGKWVKGPGIRLFEALKKELGALPMVAENLGVITPEVEALRKQLGLPGMAVLQFAFGGGAKSGHLPHNHTRDLVVYTGTHDNDTTVGWWTSPEGYSTRTRKQTRDERELARKYLDTDGKEIHWVLIRAALGSVADTCIIPLQDVLGLGSEARLNRPGRAGGNWRWRFTEEMLGCEGSKALKELTLLCGR